MASDQEPRAVQDLLAELDALDTQVGSRIHSFETIFEIVRVRVQVEIPYDGDMVRLAWQKLDGQWTLTWNGTKLASVSRDARCAAIFKGLDLLLSAVRPTLRDYIEERRAALEHFDRRVLLGVRQVLGNEES